MKAQPVVFPSILTENTVKAALDACDGNET